MTWMVYERRLEPYPVDPEICLVQVPAGAEVLSVQAKEGQPYICFLGESSAPRVPRRFRVVRSSQWLPRRLEHYVGSCAVEDSARLLHVFEEQ
jgi:hypothetical protein